LSRVAVVVAVVALAAAACSGSGGSNASDTTDTTATSTTTGVASSLTPAGDWQKVAPASVGLDAGKLDAIAKTAQAGRSNCLVVVKDGKLAGEWYWNGTGPDSVQEVFSATKSYTSTLVGMAIDAGKASLSDRASRWIPEWKGTPSDVVTLRDLLSNDSGRSWSLAQDYVQLIRARDKTAFAVGLTQTSAPGTVWAYNNSAIQTLERVVAGTLGPDVPADAQRRLLQPIGMDHSRFTTDASGHALMFMGLQSTCRDMARFGSLFLAGGAWNGTRIVSRRWVQEATGASSTKLNAAYGYLWWLNRPGRVAGPLAASSIAGAADQRVTHGQLVPGAPEDLYWAIGLGNQVIQVDPGSRTVVVRLGAGGARPEPPTFGPAEASRVVTRAVRHTK
jgi:CubicO group peptidase (beta-lactamase class C family)